jgi:hypothetical protein
VYDPAHLLKRRSRLALDPQVIAELYYRCPRCLYRHVRGQERAELPPHTFIETAAKVVEEIAGDGTFVIGSERVTLLGQHVPYSSDAELLRHQALDVNFEGEVPALIKASDGRVLAAWYERSAEQDRRGTLRDFAHDVCAYALAHPDHDSEGFDVDGIAIVAFTDVRITKPGGGAGIALRPFSMQVRKRDDERCRATARVIARIVGAPHAPPAMATCRFCAQRGEARSFSER